MNTRENSLREAGGFPAFAATAMRSRLRGNDRDVFLSKSDEGVPMSVATEKMIAQ